MTGAVYWNIKGATPEWVAKYSATPDLMRDVVLAYPEGGFAVPAGDLGFSVIVFFACATLTLGALAFRRKTSGGEVGGPKSNALLWGCVCVYVR